MTKKSEKSEPKTEASKQPFVTAEDAPGAPDLKAIRQQIRDLVGRKAVGMVNDTIGEDGGRRYLAVKYLFEMAGIFPSGTAEEDSGENALAQKPLRRLGLEEALDSESDAPKDRDTGETAKPDDAVK